MCRTENTHKEVLAAEQSAEAARQDSPTPCSDAMLTVMMRNVPNSLTQDGLISLIDQAGFVGSWDFLYLPMLKGRPNNCGYAFINFVDVFHAQTFKDLFQGMRLHGANSKLNIRPAALQGFGPNYAHYSSARIMHDKTASKPFFLRPATLEELHLMRVKQSSRGHQRRSGGDIEKLVAKQERERLGSNSTVASRSWSRNSSSGSGSEAHAEQMKEGWVDNSNMMGGAETVTVCQLPTYPWYAAPPSLDCFGDTRKEEYSIASIIRFSL